MKVIFLDFDGVLNSLASMKRHGTSEVFGEENVKALNHIIAQTGAKIVVSSAWRIVNDVEGLQRILRENGVEGVVIDKTPLISMNRRRGHEIQAWLDDYAEHGRGSVTSFVILDDNSDMEHLMPYLVQTWFEEGLTMERAEKAIEVLKKNDARI